MKLGGGGFKTPDNSLKGIAKKKKRRWAEVRQRHHCCKDHEQQIASCRSDNKNDKMKRSAIVLLLHEHRQGRDEQDPEYSASNSVDAIELDRPPNLTSRCTMRDVSVTV